MWKNKTPQPQKTCAECIHEYACSMWNVGTIHDMNAENCTNRETVKGSTAYFIGFRDGQNGREVETDGAV